MWASVTTSTGMASIVDEERRRSTGSAMLSQAQQHLRPAEGDRTQHLVLGREPGVVEHHPRTVACRLQRPAHVGTDPCRRATDAMSGEEVRWSVIQPSLEETA